MKTFSLFPIYSPESALWCVTCTPQAATLIHNYWWRAGRLVVTIAWPPHWPFTLGICRRALTDSLAHYLLLNSGYGHSWTLHNNVLLCYVTNQQPTNQQGARVGRLLIKPSGWYLDGYGGSTTVNHTPSFICCLCSYVCIYYILLLLIVVIARQLFSLRIIIWQFIFSLLRDTLVNRQAHRQTGCLTDWPTDWELMMRTADRQTDNRLSH